MIASDQEDSNELLDVMEARRSQADRFAWAVPAIAIASQAFLLTIALDGSALPARRLIAATAAFLILLASAHFYWKQMFAFQLYDAVIKRERGRPELNLVQVDRDSLLVHADSLEEWFQAKWMERDPEGNLVRSTRGDRHYLPRRTVRWKATTSWLLLFGIIATLDVGLALWALYDVLEFDWFGS